MTLAPRTEGTIPIRSSAAQFLAAFRRRVAAGLLSGRPRRSNYVIAEGASDRLRVRAADWWTAFNVGLNELELEPQAGVVHYRVRYWRWAGYALGVSAILGLIGVSLLLAVDVRGYIASHPASQFPGLSIDQSVAIAWSMVLFWGFVWPWFLIALHKRPLRRLIARLIAEVDTVPLNSEKI
jgi:hypothetical protein